MLWKNKRDKVSLSENDIRARADAHSLAKPADFSWCIIGGTHVLEGRNLSYADFSGSSCYGLSLKGCVLTGCNFKNAAFLQHVNFDGCTLDRKTAKVIKAGGGVLPDSVITI